MSARIDEQLREKVLNTLYAFAPPGHESYESEDEVTVTLTKGQAFTIRAALRARVRDQVRGLETAALFGQDPNENPIIVRDTNRLFADALKIDATLEAAAPASEFPMSDEEKRDLGYIEDEDDEQAPEVVSA